MLGTRDTAASQAEPAQFPGWQAGREAHAANTELPTVLCALKDIMGLRDREGLTVIPSGRVEDPVWGSGTLAKAWQGAEGELGKGRQAVGIAPEPNQLWVN